MSPSLDETEGDFAVRMSRLRAHIACTALEEPPGWNAMLVEGEVTEEECRLKYSAGQDVLIYDGDQVVNEPMRYSLIEEYRLMVDPALQRGGKPSSGKDTTPSQRDR